MALGDPPGTAEPPARDDADPERPARLASARTYFAGWIEPDASTLPVAGLTALTALARRGSLLGLRVVVTGAAGGVGWFAAQLAARAGAHVTGVARSADRLLPLIERGAVHTAVTSLADADGNFDLVLESTGGADLGVALGRLAPGGLVVTYGNSSRAPTPFNVSDFYGRGSVALQGLFLFDDAGAARELGGAGPGGARRAGRGG